MLLARVLADGSVVLHRLFLLVRTGMIKVEYYCRVADLFRLYPIVVQSFIKPAPLMRHFTINSY